MKLRLALGMQRRYDRLEIPVHNDNIRAVLAEELKGQSALYGRRLTYTRLKQLGVPVARNRMYELVPELDPEGVASRQFARQNIPRGEYRVAGPNRVMSVDGHHKLSLYGFEVYAGIDAYSRYITWIHVGISTRTAVAILRFSICRIMVRQYCRYYCSPLCLHAHYQTGDIWFRRLMECTYHPTTG